MHYGTPELRKRLKRYYLDSQRAFEQWAAAGYRWPGPSVPYPPECRGMACGARTRAGAPCRLTSIYANGRCKFHGGCSTGPTTAAGKRRAAQNGKTPKRKRSP